MFRGYRNSRRSTGCHFEKGANCKAPLRGRDESLSVPAHVGRWNANGEFEAAATGRRSDEALS